MKIGQKTKMDIYKEYYRNLPGKISKYYKLTYNIDIPQHAILRISLDNLFKGNWKKYIEKPAIHHLDINQIRAVVYNFKEIFDPEIMLRQIELSNLYRTNSYIKTNEFINPDIIINLGKIVEDNKKLNKLKDEHITK